MIVLQCYRFAIDESYRNNFRLPRSLCSFIFHHVSQMLTNIGKRALSTTSLNSNQILYFPKCVRTCVTRDRRRNAYRPRITWFLLIGQLGQAEIVNPRVGSRGRILWCYFAFLCCIRETSFELFFKYLADEFTRKLETLTYFLGLNEFNRNYSVPGIGALFT